MRGDEGDDREGPQPDARHRGGEGRAGRRGRVGLSENLELARRFVELGRRGDWSRLELLSEDVVYRPIAEVAEAGEYRGRDGFRSYMEAFFEASWAEDLTFEGTSFHDYGEAVIVRIELSGRGRASGLDFHARVFQVLTVEGGAIVRVEDFLQRDDALAAAGQ